MKDLRKSFLEFAEDEGTTQAVRTLEGIMSSLETIAEVGSREETDAAFLLINAVGAAIIAVLKQKEARR